MFGGVIMTIIEIEEKDLDKVFGILSSNGRFTGLPNNRFRLDENAEDVLKKIKKAKIKFTLIES